MIAVRGSGFVTIYSFVFFFFSSLAFFCNKNWISTSSFFLQRCIFNFVQMFLKQNLQKCVTNSTKFSLKQPKCTPSSSLVRSDLNFSVEIKRFWIIFWGQMNGNVCSRERIFKICQQMRRDSATKVTAERRSQRTVIVPMGNATTNQFAQAENGIFGTGDLLTLHRALKYSS